MPGPGEIHVSVSACGVCRTDLHLAEGDVEPRHHGVVPGHEIVGVVDAVGAGATRFEPGQRAGIAWLRHTCGRCRWCVRGDENLCATPRFTGWDDDGGYAEFAVVDEAYALTLPDRFGDEQAAPLLCAPASSAFVPCAARAGARWASRHLRLRSLRPAWRPAGAGPGARCTCALVRLRPSSSRSRFGVTSAGGSDEPPPSL